jgi:hypothetical protein
MSNTEPVSLNVLAKILGRSKSGLFYLERAGHIQRNSQGKFDIAEVQRAIAESVDQTKSHRRKGVRTQGVRTRAETRSNSGEEVEVRVDGRWIPIERAKAMRDRYLALLAELNERRLAGKN